MSTKYLAAYALCSLQTPNPTKDDVIKVLESVNISVDQNDLDFVFEAISGRTVAELIANGNSVLSKTAVAAGPAAGAASGAVTASGAAAPAAEAKKEEEPEEEDDDLGFGGLF